MSEVRGEKTETEREGLSDRSSQDPPEPDSIPDSVSSAQESGEAWAADFEARAEGTHESDEENPASDDDNLIRPQGDPETHPYSYPCEKLQEHFAWRLQNLPPGVTPDDYVNDRVVALEQLIDCDIVLHKADREYYRSRGLLTAAAEAEDIPRRPGLQDLPPVTVDTLRNLKIHSATTSLALSAATNPSASPNPADLAGITFESASATTSQALPAQAAAPATETAAASTSGAPISALQLLTQPRPAAVAHQEPSGVNLSAPPPAPVPSLQVVAESSTSARSVVVGEHEESTKRPHPPAEEPYIDLTCDTDKKKKKKQKQRQQQSPEQQQQQKQDPQEKPQEYSLRWQRKGGRPPVSPITTTAPSSSPGRHSVRESSPGSSSDNSLRDAFPDSRPELVRTTLFAGTPELTFDWRVQHLQPLPPVDYAALQYANKRDLLFPVRCAQDFESHEEHLQALLSFCHNQLTQRKSSQDLEHSYLRGLIIAQLRAECQATLQFLRKLLHRHHCDAFNAGQQEKFQSLIRELILKIDLLRPKVHIIYDRTISSYRPTDKAYLESDISAEKDVICGVVRVLWDVERPIRAYLRQLITRRQVQEAGPSLQVHCDIVSNERARREHLRLHPEADL